MKINDLILAASKAYDADGVLEGNWDFRHERPFTRATEAAASDGLARFICVELFETFDPQATDAAQIEEAVRVMTSAQRQVQAVIDAFENLGVPKCRRCGTPLLGGFCQDVTCRFSDHVQACECGFAAACICGDHIIATFQPQYADARGYIHDCDEDKRVRFDVTEQILAILAMPRENACKIRDDQFESDILIPSDIRDLHDGPFRLIPSDIRDLHDGPFRVEIEDAIQAYFEQHPLKEKTEVAAK